MMKCHEDIVTSTTESILFCCFPDHLFNFFFSPLALDFDLINLGMWFHFLFVSLHGTSWNCWSEPIADFCCQLGCQLESCLNKKEVRPNQLSWWESVDVNNSNSLHPPAGHRLTVTGTGQVLCHCVVPVANENVLNLRNEDLVNASPVRKALIFLIELTKTKQVTCAFFLEWKTWRAMPSSQSHANRTIECLTTHPFTDCRTGPKPIRLTTGKNHERGPFFHFC